MALDIEQKKKILDFIPSLSEIAKKKKWISNYDTETDSIAIHSPRLSPNYTKMYFNDDFAFYLNSKNEVGGIFIEYFVTNFISHNDYVRPLKKEIVEEIKTKKDAEESALVRLESKETKRIIPELENALVSSIFPKS